MDFTLHYVVVKNIYRILRHKPSQIQMRELWRKVYLVYTEDLSKNYPSELKDRKSNKSSNTFQVSHHANIEKPERCFVCLYKLYNSHCSPNHPDNAYYSQPSQRTSDAKYWYTNQPVAIEHSKLDPTIQRMCNEAGTSGSRTNHSLRATAATWLHQCGYVEEQQVMERTGHISTETVRSYKRTSKERSLKKYLTSY